MKSKWVWLISCIAFIDLSAFAQDNKSLSIHEVIQLATTQSKEAKAAETKVTGKKLDLNASKNEQLPEAKITGQFAVLSTPDINLRIPLGNENGTPNIKANQLMLAQASVSMPIYAGGKIKNSIHIAEEMVLAEQFAAATTKEQIANQAIKLYVTLYKAQQTVNLVEENIKRSEQQVIDFKAMEENGLIARNDLLKSELQLLNYKAALQEAVKNVKVSNYQLNKLLQLNEDTKIEQISFEHANEILNEQFTFDSAQQNRNDLKLLTTQHKIATDQLKISKANYLPSVALTGGYVAADIKNVIAVTNALNAGVGLSYDLGSLYKNKKNVAVAKHRIEEVEEQIGITNDRIKIQLQEANENFTLAQNQEKVYAQAVIQANENYRIVKDKYDNGVADTDDLLEADVQQLQSNINEALSKANVIEKYYDLLLVNGQLISN